MKKVISSLLCLVAPFANALQVSGQGATFEEAKLHAFRTAIEFTAGSVVTSERESNNYKLVKDEILVYSAGYVTDYKIINSIKSGDQFQVIIDVQVASSKLSDRILGVAKEPKNINGDQHAYQYKTYLNSKKDADKLLNQLLNDYPSKAYIINQGTHKIKVDAYRNAILEIPLELKWNYNFIVSFNEAMGILEDGGNGLIKHSPGSVTVIAKDPKDWVIGSKSSYKFNDLVIVNNIRNMLKQPPNILLSIKNFDNNVIFKQCYVPEAVVGKKPAFYNIGPALSIYGNQVEKNSINLVIDNMENTVKLFKSIDLTVVADKDCP